MFLQRLSLVSAAWLLAVLPTARSTEGPEVRVPAVIIDTDIDSDVDDVEAVALAHALADRKEIALLGVVVTSDDPFAPLCVAALNHAFGRPGLPVGFLKGQAALRNHSRYTRQLAHEFPHAFGSADEVPDGTDVYRRLLAAAADGSVVVVTLGHLSSLQRLLESAPDAVSSLTGRRLVEKKVVRWICMGGQFPRGKEANFYRPDPGSTLACLRDWPKPVTFCGWELGNPIKTGGVYLQTRLAADHPVARAYDLYNRFAGRASWDQVAVLLLSHEAKAFFDTVAGGHCQVYPDGSNEWRTDQVRAHDYVVLKPGIAPETVARWIDNLVPTLRR